MNPTPFKTRRETTRNRLADHVAEHGMLDRAAIELGISQGYARRLWAEIRTGLGSQAA